ncbi:MAG: hypothetical protein GX130_11760 [Candidatus Hydrogenedens sp.]|jgi:hypothetical protein|nr:hypothetical protein [Candidatus Hydrogenedens sp.]
MKLLTLKLIALVVFLGGALSLGLALNLDQAQQVFDQCLAYWPATEGGVPYLGVPGIVVSALIALIALYAFFPRLPSGKKKYITRSSSEGTVVLELPPLRKSLLKVMRTMPEIAKIDVELRPDRSRKTVCVIANVILNNRKDFSEEMSATTVARVLAVTCKEVLGLEEISSIVVNVQGIRFDVDETCKKVRARAESLETPKEESSCEESSSSKPPALPEKTADSEETTEDKEPAEETAADESSVTTEDTETAARDSEAAEAEATPESAEEAPEVQQAVAEETEEVEEAPEVQEAAAEETEEVEEAPEVQEAAVEETEEVEEAQEVQEAVAEETVVTEEAEDDESSDNAPAPLSSFSLPPLTAREEETPLAVVETADSTEEEEEEEEDLPDALPEAEETSETDKPQENNPYL